MRGVLILLTLFSVTASGWCNSVVLQWNTAALNAIRADKTPPPKSSRNLAILHASIYDAVNGITRTHESYFVPSAVPASASQQAAANAAAHRVLVSLYPSPALIAGFDALHLNVLATLQTGPQLRSGIAWGESVAEQILAWRENDGANATVLPPLGDGPGDWQSTLPLGAPYLLPQWAFLTCFAMTDPTQFRPLGPPALSSAKWAEACNEVKALGGMTGSTRTPDQDQIALFWADGAGTETPPGHWNSIARDIAFARGNTLEQDARLFALLNIAMADAAICAWNSKYEFSFWRPVTAIRNAQTDGNEVTVSDPAWNSFITTPPFPEYISGHSTFSGAASAVLALFYGTDNIPFVSRSDFLPTVLRSFDHFSAAAEEAAISRLYGGIHFRFSNEDGLASGLAIGNWSFTHYLQPKGNRSRN